MRRALPTRVLAYIAGTPRVRRGSLTWPTRATTVAAACGHDWDGWARWWPWRENSAVGFAPASRTTETLRLLHASRRLLRNPCLRRKVLATFASCETRFSPSALFSLFTPQRSRGL